MNGNDSPHANIDSLLAQVSLNEMMSASSAEEKSRAAVQGTMERFYQMPEVESRIQRFGQQEKRLSKQREINRVLKYIESDPKNRAILQSLTKLTDAGTIDESLPLSVEEDVFGGKQYTFKSDVMAKLSNALAFARGGRGYLPEELSEYHPFQQLLIKVHEASHAKRQRTPEGTIKQKGTPWHEKKEEQLAETEAGEFVLRNAGLLGKYTPLETMLMLSNRPLFTDRSSTIGEWVKNPDAPVESLVFTEPESRVRADLQEMPAFSQEQLQGTRTYFLKEGSFLPSFTSKEAPEDIREHWNLRSKSLINLLRMNPGILLTEEGGKLMSSLRTYEKSYPSFYENVAVPLSQMTE